MHVVELDRSLEPALRDALDPFAATTALHLADAMALDLAALAPAPTKVVANLPYGIAAGAILRTIEELPSVTRWVAMVQKEVGERFAAAPGSGAYGVPSVLAQLACDVRVLRPISRRVFFPVPNVDSVLVGLERRGRRRAGRPRCARSCRARSRTGARRSRARSRSPAWPRATTCAPHWRRSASRSTCAPSGSRPSACASCGSVSADDAHRARPRQDEPLPVPRRDARRRAARARLGDRAAVARRRADAGAAARRRAGRRRGRRGRHGLRRRRGRGRVRRRRGAEPRRRGARRLPSRERLGRAAAAPDDRQARAGRGGHGRRLGRRGRRAAARRRTPPAAPTIRCSRSSRRALGADVPSQVAPGPVLVGGAGRGRAGARAAAAPRRARAALAARALDARRLPRGGPARPAALRRTSWRSGARRWRRRSRAAGCRLPVNDLEPAARSLCPSIDEALAAAREAGADHALVSGSGPTVVGHLPRPRGVAAAAARPPPRCAPASPARPARTPVDAAFAAVRGVWHDDDRA